LLFNTGKQNLQVVATPRPSSIPIPINMQRFAPLLRLSDGEKCLECCCLITIVTAVPSVASVAPYLRNMRVHLKITKKPSSVEVFLLSTHSKKKVN